MSLSINNLIFEVTRKCNIKCQHCLRGEPQKIDMPYEAIDRALDGVSRIGTITFTGGEPTLAVSRIRYTLKSLKAHRIKLDSFFMYTNGKIASQALAHTLIDLYSYCEEYEREEICGLIISGDQYHKEQIKDVTRAENLYKGLSFYQKRKNDDYWDPHQVIAEGRAAEWGGRSVFDHRDNDMCRIESRSEDGDLYVEGELYINALGDVIPNCNLSYESQEKVKLGNVLQKSLTNILKPFDVNPKDLIETLSKRVA